MSAGLGITSHFNIIKLEHLLDQSFNEMRNKIKADANNDLLVFIMIMFQALG